MMFFNNNYYEEYGNVGRVAGAAGAGGAAARSAGAAGAAGAAARSADAAKAAEAAKAADLGTDYTKFDVGTPQRRFSYDNYLKSQKNPPKLLNDIPTLNKIDTDLNKIDNLDNVKSVDDIPDTSPDTKKLINETPENIKADLTPENKVKFDQDYKKLFDDIDTPEFKAKTSKEKFDSVKKWVKENYKLIGATAVGAAFLGMYIKAQIDANRINSTEYKITSITSDKDDKVMVVYDPRDRFTLNDKIIISETNSVPKIDGSDIELTYVGNGIITFSGEEITTNGTSGKLQCRTTVEDQFRQNVNNAVNPIIDIVGDTAGNVRDTILDTIIPKEIRDFFKKWWWIVLIICILFLISSSAAVVFLYMK